MRLPQLPQAGLTLSLAFALAACSSGAKQDDNAPLAFVPADTPYIVANLEPIPRSVSASWVRALQPVHQGYQESLARGREVAERSGDPERQRLVSILELFEDKFTLEGWENIGISPQSLSAVYGIGVQPVARIALADREKFRSFVQTLEARVGTTAPVAQIENVDYWRFPIGDNNDAAIVVAIVGDHLVVTIDVEYGEPLPRLLGLERPANSMVDATALAQINREYGYTNYTTMLIDMPRLVDALIGADDNASTMLTRMMADEGAEPVSAQCRSEVRTMVQQWPRLVMGYTVMDERRQEAVGVLELESELARSLSTLAAPVPGMGSNRDGIEFGMSLKLDKLAEFIQARASAIRAAPYACEWFQPLNEGAEEVGQQLAGLYMAAAWFTGARIVVKDFELGEDGMPRRIDGMFMLVAPNPTSLVAMAKGFVPQLASLDLVAGAPPQRLDIDSMGVPAEIDMPVWVAMSDTAIAMATGADAESSLSVQLAERAPEPAPLVHVSYNGALYGRIMRAVEDATGQSMTGFGAPDTDSDYFDDGDDSYGDVEDGYESDMDGVDPIGDGDDVEIAGGNPAWGEDATYVFEPLLKSVHSIYDAMGYVGSDFLVSERGVEMRSVTTLR